MKGTAVSLMLLFMVLLTVFGAMLGNGVCGSCLCTLRNIWRSKRQKILHGGEYHGGAISTKDQRLDGDRAREEIFRVRDIEMGKDGSASCEEGEDLLMPAACCIRSCGRSYGDNARCVGRTPQSANGMMTRGRAHTL